MIDAATLRGWAGEIRTELTAARAELNHQIEAARAAQEFADHCRAEQASTNMQLAAVREPLAFRLAGRVRLLGDRATAAAAEAVTARNQIALTREKLEDLEQAAQQTGALLAALTPTEAESEEPAHAT